jgi:hypothetical protein
MGLKVLPPFRDGPPPPGLYRAEKVVAGMYPLHVYVDGEGPVRYCLADVFREWEMPSRAGKDIVMVRVPPSERGGSPWKKFAAREVLTKIARRGRQGEARDRRVGTALMLETGGFSDREAELVTDEPEVLAPLAA